MTTTATIAPVLWIAICSKGHTVKADNGSSAWTKGHLLCSCGSLAQYPKQMRITIKAAKECGSVCMGAQGPSCSCSCGGENHGSSH